MITVRSNGSTYRFPDNISQDVMKQALDTHIQSLRGQSMTQITPLSEPNEIPDLPESQSGFKTDDVINIQNDIARLEKAKAKAKTEKTINKIDKEIKSRQEQLARGGGDNAV